ncbi:MAG: hypothetical protein RSG96_09985, partial [Clostridia bacterium]
MMKELLVACGLNMDYGLQAALPGIHQTAEELWNGLARAETAEQVKQIFAAQGYELTDAMTQELLTGREGILAMAGQMGMDINTMLGESVAETEITLQKSATEWGRIFGEAIPAGATVGLENGMYVLRAKTGEVIKIVSAVDAKTDVEQGNKDAAKAGVDAMSGELKKGESTVETASQGVSDSITTSLEPFPGLMKGVGEAGTSGMATGITSKQDGVTAATETISDAAVQTALRTMSVANGQRIGQGFGGGIVAGLQSKSGSLSSTARSVASSGRSAAQGILNSSTGYPMGRDMVQGIIGGAESMRSALMNRFRSLANSAVGAFRNALQMH